VSLSLIPWAVFLVASTVADVRYDGSTSLVGLVLAAPLYLGFVALPAFLPLAVARHPATKAFEVANMTAAAGYAGIAMATSDDAQAGLAVFVVADVGIPLAGIVWTGQVVVPRLRTWRPGGETVTSEPADILRRLQALVVDVLLVAAALVVPLTAMSHAGYEVAATAVGIAVGTAYAGIAVAWKGRTLGQWAVRVVVVDAATGERLGPVRAVARGLVVIVELIGAATLVFSLAALTELVAALLTGRSLTDRLLRSAMLTTTDQAADVHEVGPA